MLRYIALRGQSKNTEKDWYIYISMPYPKEDNIAYLMYKEFKVLIKSELKSKLMTNSSASHYM